ncbi:MAG: DEAD/DEAH box helicase, partial [Microcystaceae cyanobacterium]
MTNHHSVSVVAELGSRYQSGVHQAQWVEVLVDCPGVQGLFTYRLPPDVRVQPGDILSVPFGAQMLGGIAIRQVASLPPDLEPSRIREVEEVITSGFFPPSYWQLLNQVAHYYCTELMTVIRVALPPGLLGRSQRRIRLKPESIPKDAEAFCHFAAQQILRLLKSQKEGDYSVQYLYRQVRNAKWGLRDLLKRGWVESYLEPPKATRPKQQKAVTLVVDTFPLDITERQREVLEVLRHRGGELWLNQLLQICHASSSLVETLASKGYVAVEYREKLRFLAQPETIKDRPKQLTTSQTEALAVIRDLAGFGQVLVHGITGSGKTEIYLQAIAPILAAGKSALVLVPEIGLTPQLTDRFCARFGHQVCVYHSALSDGERYDTWRQMLAGQPQV